MDQILKRQSTIQREKYKMVLSLQRERKQEYSLLSALLIHI